MENLTIFVGKITQNITMPQISNLTYWNFYELNALFIKIRTTNVFSLCLNKSKTRRYPCSN